MADDCGSRNTLQKTFDGAREKLVVICQQDCRGARESMRIASTVAPPLPVAPPAATPVTAR